MTTGLKVTRRLGTPILDAALVNRLGHFGEAEQAEPGVDAVASFS